MSEVRDIWNQGAELYDQIYANNVPYHRSHEVVADLLPKGRQARVLDLGAGTGVLAHRILERLPDSHVTCIDFSPEMIRQCGRRLARYGRRLELICDDIAEWRPTQVYDAVVTCNALVYKEINLGECYAKYASALARGGLFLNSTVVTHDAYPFEEALLGNLHSPGAQQPQEEVLEFARGPGRRIAHLGEESLAVAYTVEEHLALMKAAGLAAACPWRYFAQAVLVGSRMD